MSQKVRVAVLYGGKADEHSISCVSVGSVLRAIDTDRYDVLPIGITKDGVWIVDGEDPRAWSLNSSPLPTVQETEHSRRVVLDPSAGALGFMAQNADGSVESLGAVDVVFPVLHGPYGEDGTVQGLLEMMNVPYVGCGVLASAACMDKHYTKVLLSAAGIAVSPGFTLDARKADTVTGTAVEAQVEQEGLTWPLFVKPSRAGSSFGVTKVEWSDDRGERQARLAAAVQEAAEHDWRILVEQGIDAREIECAVLRSTATGEARVSWPGEIVLDSRASNADSFYDFDSKYMDASASHVEVPANLPKETLQRVREVAARAFDAVDGMGLSRVDTFVTPDGDVLVNEINTMPGFTAISMYPKAWEASGLPYSDLIATLIEGVHRK